MIWLSLLFLILLIDLMAHLAYGRLVLRVFESKPLFSVPPFSPDPTAELVSFQTSDGITLRGSLHRQAFRPAKGLILFCPELEGSHWSAASYAQALLEEGYNVFSFDFRNQGESDGQQGYAPLHWPTTYEIEDVRAALRSIQTYPDLKSLPLGIMGISRGSMIALIAAAESPQVKAVCCEGAYSTDALTLHYIWRWCSLYAPRYLLSIVPTWHVRLTVKLVRRMSQFLSRRRYVVVERWLPKLKDRPVLLIAGACDSYVDPGVGRELANRINSDNVQFWLVPSARHNRARNVAGGEYDRRLCEFFNAALAPELVTTEAINSAASASGRFSTANAATSDGSPEELAELQPVV